MILLDTNLLARVTNKGDPQCLLARSAVHALLGRNERLVIVPQNLYEFWAVATRKPGPPPDGQNGLGMTADQASHWLDFFRRRFVCLPDPDDLPTRWQSLVKARRIMGFKAHDARLAAAMQCHGIARLLTFNGKDFQGLGITVLDPATI